MVPVSVVSWLSSSARLVSWRHLSSLCDIAAQYFVELPGGVRESLETSLVGR